MVRRCSVGGCSNTQAPLHCLPLDAKLRTRWIKFILLTRTLDQNMKTIVVCSKHFHKSDYRNVWKVDMGFAKNLKLNEDAVPSIKGPGMSLTVDLP